MLGSQMYDQFGEAGVKRGAGASGFGGPGGFEVNDIFETFFGGKGPLSFSVWLQI
jgi:molecular chaperone DnaJ